MPQVKKQMDDLKLRGENIEADMLKLQLDDVANAEALQEDVITKKDTNVCIADWTALADAGHTVPELTNAHLTRKLCRDYLAADERAPRWKAAVIPLWGSAKPIDWTPDAPSFASCELSPGLAKDPKNVEKWWNHWRDAVCCDPFMLMIQKSPGMEPDVNPLVHMCKAVVTTITGMQIQSEAPDWMKPLAERMLKLLRGLLALFCNSPLC